MNIVCLDMEGVLVPEIWIRVAEKTRIPELRLTTRDIPDYDMLMKQRLGILRKKNIKLRQIQQVIGAMDPFPGAKAFLDKLRHTRQVVILSDTYYEFAMPLMKKLGHPVLFCNWLIEDKKGFIADYVLRRPDGKKNAVLAFKSMGLAVFAAGDSYNDVTMLKTADRGILFNPPVRITKEYPSFPVTTNYQQLFKALAV